MVANEKVCHLVNSTISMLKLVSMLCYSYVRCHCHGAWEGSIRLSMIGLLGWGMLV